MDCRAPVGNIGGIKPLFVRKWHAPICTPGVYSCKKTMTQFRIPMDPDYSFKYLFCLYQNPLCLKATASYSFCIATQGGLNFLIFLNVVFYIAISVSLKIASKYPLHTHTHTHTHIYIIYMLEKGKHLASIVSRGNLNMNWTDSSIGKSARLVIWRSEVRILIQIKIFLLKSKF